MQTPNLVPSQRVSNFLRAQGVERPQNFGKFEIVPKVQPTMEIQNFDWLETYTLGERAGVAIAGAQNDAIIATVTRNANNLPKTQYIWTNKIWVQCTAETTPQWVYLTAVTYTPTDMAIPNQGSVFGFLGTNASDSLIGIYHNAVLPPGWYPGIQIVPYGGAIDVTITIRLDFRSFST